MSEVIASEKCCSFDGLELLFQNTVLNQRLKVLKTLMRTVPELFYANFILISNKLSCL